VWAGEDHDAIVRAAWGAGIAAGVVIFFFGFVGLLALWSGRASLEQTDANLFFFAIFSDTPVVCLSNAPGFLAMLCAAVMSCGAVDSMQNGIAATASSFLQGYSLTVTRAFVGIINAAVVALACAQVQLCEGYSDAPSLHPTVPFF